MRLERDMDIIECSASDAPKLAEMNQMLIKDERAETSLDLSQLRRRMIDLMASGYKAFLFEDDGKTVGYALCDMKKAPVYLRQFFICRGERRKGYGKRAFQALLEHIGANDIEIDVYVWNERGIAFWEYLGFEKRCYNMRYQKSVE